MNKHLKRGLVASSIAFSLVVIAGALDIYFDPPVDAPSVGYYALGWLVRAVIALSLGVGFTIFVLVALDYGEQISNPKKKSQNLFSYLVRQTQKRNL